MGREKNPTYAKSKLPDGRKITVTEHCTKVSDVAGGYGAEIGLENNARLVGLFHDFGKRGQLFQGVLDGREHGVDHALPGAAFLWNNDEHTPSMVIEAIAAHHCGLASAETLAGLMKAAYNGGQEEEVSSARGRVSIVGREQYVTAFSEMVTEAKLKTLPSPKKALYGKPGWKSRLHRMMTTRFLLSCQVDADYSVSQWEEDQDGSIFGKNRIENVDTLIERLNCYRAGIKATSKAAQNITELRDMVFEDCTCAGADTQSDTLSLTAPTGAGKTLGMISLALQRCRSDPSKQRIILVLPYLSLVEQVADIVKEIIPGTIVDTSQAEQTEESWVQAKNWNAPCVITTSVQFFGSLLSDRPASCRKLHNMANAVIILDEVQTLPNAVVRYAAQTLHWLAEEYNSCVVLSTATQPALDRLPDTDWSAKEVIRDVPACFALAIPKKYEALPGSVNLRELARMAAAQGDNVCIITNLRRHARTVYEALTEEHEEGVYLLSTDLCPAHRLAIISEIKSRQRDGLPVYVAATQCIEAGVDLDFERVYRAWGPLPSIVQAAGRQNRNGRYLNTTTVIFEPERERKGERLYPDPGYEFQALLARALYAEGADLATVQAVACYYGRLYHNFSEPEELETALTEVDYSEVADKARLIQDSGRQVIVPYKGRRALFDEIRAAVNTGKVGKKHLAAAAGITVQSYNPAVADHCAELVIHRWSGEDIQTGVYILLEGHEGCYNEKTGLDISSLDSSAISFV